MVGGRAARLDALDWIGVIAGDRGGDGLALRRIDVNTAQLRLLGTQFADARVLVVPAPRGTAVLVQAATLAGSLLVPIPKKPLMAFQILAKKPVGSTGSVGISGLVWVGSSGITIAGCTSISILDSYVRNWLKSSV